jgi:hypothetical protein
MKIEAHGHVNYFQTSKEKYSLVVIWVLAKSTVKVNVIWTVGWTKDWHNSLNLDLFLELPFDDFVEIWIECPIKCFIVSQIGFILLQGSL